MGAEALCRGASYVVAIEQSNRACAIIQQNWQRVRKPEQTFQVLRGDVVQRLKTLGQQFDRIYFDPPYASDLYQPVLNAISYYQLLAPTGELAVEHSSVAWKHQPIPNLEICREKVYGNTVVTFYHPAREESCS
jgi:16S rRNA (guanine(966)-N(2))-methyltransferase RsmD